jgi:putative drug exporter of the RND superfamily
VSSFLYGLGRAAYRRRLAVLMAWLTLLVVIAGVAFSIQKGFDEDFSLPGTESQEALDSLNRTFPQAGGTTAQIVVVTPDGGSVRDASVRDAIETSVQRLEQIDQVDRVTSPFDKYANGVISDDGRAAIVVAGMNAEQPDISASTYAAIDTETKRLQSTIPGSQVSAGGEAYGNEPPGVTPTEGIGVLVALVVLLFTLGSLRAAGMPLLTALLGVALTMLLIVAATGITTVSSTTPLLALMLGLAVGIDYALFITSRHRDQLRDGLDAQESVARALATAGSAVVFAGMTVMIALCGLAVAGIPFLTTMGVAASIGVGIAVLIALTLLPALLGFAGERLRPSQHRKGSARTPSRVLRRTPRVGLARGWLRLTTKAPALTVLIVVIGLLLMSYPAKDLRLALPSNATAAPGSSARTTYDLISEHFGPGYNGPLIVTAVIVSSDDPLGVLDDIAGELRKLPGVANVPLAIPNEDADTGIIQVIPTTAPDSEETKELVARIRGLQQHFVDEYQIETAVTGYTAVQVDISDRLSAALLPFGVLVVGLSLLLLTMVFRSVAVPLKATIGYLLSVGAAFGVTAAVFEWGWFSSLLNVDQTGPVISFLPILLMGILFGLAMDYEVFLVSRIREEYVHGGDAGRAIEAGFTASARVVAAAALIMFAVFAAFVPESEGPIKTIAFGLAVGVAIDAFAVRMTLVPAVLALLGRRAWWLPGWIERRLPSFDVEGKGLTHQVSLSGWPAPDDDHVVAVSGLRLHDRADDVSIGLRSGQVLVVEGPPESGKSALLLTLAGRMQLVSGAVKVTGLVLPEQASAVRQRTGVVDGADGGSLRAQLRSIERRHPAVVFVDHADAVTNMDDRVALASLLDDLVVGQLASAVVLAVRDRNAVADLIPNGYFCLTLNSVPVPTARPGS